MNKLKKKDKPEIILDSHKLIWHKERVESWLAGERVAPLEVECALTRRCNYACTYCYGQLQANDEKKITKDVIFRFLDDAREVGVKSVAFIGDGENTCSPHLYEAIKHGKANGLDMALGTNGSLLKKKRLEEIMPCLTYLRFNMSAGESKRYADIHGCKESSFEKVCENIREAVKVKKKKDLETTIGVQMVLLPSLSDQIIPLSKLGKELGVDYLIIKHCSDDEKGTLGVDYQKYSEEQLVKRLEKAEAMSREDYLVKVKWSKILSGGKRKYSKCYGPQFLLQMSGSGLVAPCGPLFHSQYREKFHIGNIVDTPFREILKSARYREVMDHLSSNEFNPHTQCGVLCMQHKVNEYLWDLKQGAIKLKDPVGAPPMHVNFI